MTIDLGVQTFAADELQQRVGGLIGQPFSGARTSYGDELRLSFGTGDEPTSRWRLGTRPGGSCSARWVSWAATPTVLWACARLRHSTMQGIGAVDITRSDRTLTLVFGTGHRFVLLPNKPHRSKDDLDLWELFSPTAGGWRSAATARST
jgi:hypothetical protein